MKNLFATIPFALLLSFLSSCVTSLSESVPLTEQERSDLLAADVVILGEVHDNPLHHQIQATIIRYLSSQRRVGGIYLEQVEREQQAVLDGLSKKDLAQAGERLEWQKRGWPDFTFYRSIFEAAYEASIPLIAANIAASSSKAIYAKGYDAVFSQEEQERVGLTQALPAAAQQSLERSIVEGHCNMITADHAAQMIPIQRARDAAMALRFLSLPEAPTPAVFIVGSGHARKDFGIPWYVKHAAPGLKIWTLGMGEVGADTDLTGVYDRSLKTVAATRDDPCENLKKSLRKGSKGRSIPSS